MKNKRIWLGLGLFLLANYLLVLLQNAVANWQWRHQAPLSFFFPEARYWLPTLVVFLPLVPMALLRFRHGRKILLAVASALVLYAVCFLAKAHIPGTRRQQYVAACDWAVEKIRADYRGPKADAEPYFTWLEYHPLARPCVEAHETRVSYLLGGRGASLHGCGRADTPDYIVNEPSKVDRIWWAVADYDKLAEKRFGGVDWLVNRFGGLKFVRKEFSPHDFVIYRRIR